MHGSKIKTPRQTGAWFAVIVGLDGRPCGRLVFPNEKEGTASFESKAERVELYDGRKVLMWSKRLGNSR